MELLGIYMYATVPHHDTKHHSIWEQHTYSGATRYMYTTVPHHDTKHHSIWEQHTLHYSVYSVNNYIYKYIGSFLERGNEGTNIYTKCVCIHNINLHVVC